MKESVNAHSLGHLDIKTPMGEGRRRGLRAGISESGVWVIGHKDIWMRRLWSLGTLIFDCLTA